MTRAFHQKIQCSNCGCWTTAETGFSRWIREREDLDSKEDGIVCCDMDYIVHRYKTAADNRNVQCIMFIEVKTRGAKPTSSQQDTLVLFEQFLNNRRETPTKKNAKPTVLGSRRHAFSLLAGKRIEVRAFGGYLLTFEQTGPLDSKWMTWGRGRREITQDQLAALIRFDLDPDTLAPLDLRRHHEQPGYPLFDGLTG